MEILHKQTLHDSQGDEMAQGSGNGLWSLSFLGQCSNSFQAVLAGFNTGKKCAHLKCLSSRKQIRLKMNWPVTKNTTMQINSTKQPLKKNPKQMEVTFYFSWVMIQMEMLWKHTGCQGHPTHLPAQICYTTGFCMMPARSSSSEWVRPRKAGSDQMLLLSNFNSSSRK